MRTLKKESLPFLYCLLAAAVCLAICSKSSFLYPINDWTDANAYLSCGRGMLAGRVMYRDLYEHKGPLLYALHALCCLVDHGGFLGVYLLEVLAGGVFLWFSYKLAILYGANRTSLWLAPLLGALIYTSFSFQQGDSAEELCLPLLLASLYSLLRWLRTQTPKRMTVTMLVWNGFLGGCVLWIKFTLLGFYAPWLLGLMVYHLIRHEGRAAWTVLWAFAVGALLATLPWIVYFGVNGAILPWLKTYLYDNLFLYADSGAMTLRQRLGAAFHAGWDWLRLNPAYTAPMALGMLWLTLCPRAQKRPGQKPGLLPCVSAAEKAFVWALLAFTTTGVFIGGKSYVYYGLILAVFAPLGMAAVARALHARETRRRWLGALLAALALPLAGAYSLWQSPNVTALLEPRAQTMQYQFAALVNRTPNATLLNYGFMDAGFYTACDIAPSVKYFHQTNVPLEEMLSEQERYVAEGVTDYVVTRGRQPDSIGLHYTLIATAKPPTDFWYDTVYLYRRNDIQP